LRVKISKLEAMLNDSGVKYDRAMTLLRQNVLKHRQETDYSVMLALSERCGILEKTIINMRRVYEIA
jgi:hypothetical protein